MAANFVLPITKLSVTKESGIKFMGCLRGMKKVKKQENRQTILEQLIIISKEPKVSFK